MEFQTQTFLTGSSLKIVFYINENGFGVILGYPGPRPLPLPLPLRHHFPLAPVFRPPHDLRAEHNAREKSLCFDLHWVHPRMLWCTTRAKVPPLNRPGYKASVLCVPPTGGNTYPWGICVRGNTYHWETPMTVTREQRYYPRGVRVRKTDVSRPRFHWSAVSVTKCGIDDHIWKARDACLISCFQDVQALVVTSKFRDYEEGFGLKSQGRLQHVLAAVYCRINLTGGQPACRVQQLGCLLRDVHCYTHILRTRSKNSCSKSL